MKMNKKILKISSIIFFTILFSFGAYKVSYFIGETYFFDKIFYKKSVQHGYFEPQSQLNQLTLKKPLRQRLADLNQLIYKQKQVLGITANNEKFTIAIVGDSMTYGLGVKKNETLVAVLEKKLNRIRPTKIYNYSQPGDDVINNYLKYKIAKENQNIDLFIISLVDNDLIFNNIDRYPQNENIYLEILSECGKKPKFFQYSNLDSGDEWIEKLYHPSFSEEHSNICFLKRIISRFDMSDTFFFSFSHIPTQIEIDQKPINNISLKIFEIFSKYNSIIVGDNHGYILDPYGDKGVEYIRISNSEGHPSNETHMGYAQVLFDEINTNQRWGFVE